MWQRIQIPLLIGTQNAILNRCWGRHQWGGGLAYGGFIIPGLSGWPLSDRRCCNRWIRWCDIAWEASRRERQCLLQLIITLLLFFKHTKLYPNCYQFLFCLMSLPVRYLCFLLWSSAFVCWTSNMFQNQYFWECDLSQSRIMLLVWWHHCLKWPIQSESNASCSP